MSEKNQSQAMLYPLIEDDEVMCAHGGKVILKSIKGKPFKSGDVPLILEPDMQNALISGCSNSILGIPQPCLMVTGIPPSALSIKKFNGEKAVIQDYVGMITTDKGVPLQCVPKPNKWKVAASVPASSGEEKDKSNSKKEKCDHIFHIRYSLKRDNTDIINGAEYVKIYNSSPENELAETILYDFRKYDIDNPITVSLGKEKESDENIHSDLKKYLTETYSEKFFSYKAISLEIGDSIFEYIFLGLKDKRYESSFGFMPTGKHFKRYTVLRTRAASVAVFTAIIKVSFTVKNIQLVIS